MKTQVLLASLALPLLAIAGDQKPMSHPLDFVDRIFKDHDDKPDIPPEHFLSMLEANKLCGNESTVTLEAPGMGFLTFMDGRAYVRNSSDDGLHVPLEWTMALFRDDSQQFAIFTTDPFGRTYYLYNNGGHLTVTSVPDYAGRYSVRYTSNLKPSRIVLSSSERCVTVDRGDDKVYLLDNSPCTPFAFKKIEKSGTGRGSGGEPMDTTIPTKWYNPVDDSNPTCPSTLKKYMSKYKNGELNELMAMSPDEIHALGWPGNLGNFIMGLPLSIVGAAACGVACAAGSVHCGPCQGEGGII
ncbi:hypothetical protein EV127DRAFT_140755 [Xylaria flabelliformis]|nr:hypothetical protein EV127DRAFT_140755 [Xylaria flabelliformis]